MYYHYCYLDFYCENARYLLYSHVRPHFWHVFYSHIGPELFFLFELIFIPFEINKINEQFVKFNISFNLLPSIVYVLMFAIYLEPLDSLSLRPIHPHVTMKTIQSNQPIVHPLFVYKSETKIRMEFFFQIRSFFKFFG